MRRRATSNDLMIVEPGYLLKDSFADNYEHEVYFALVSSIELNEHFPSELEIEFEEGGKAPRLKYPKKKPDVIVVVLPIAKSDGSPRKRHELRERAISKYSGLIPKVRLEIKDELAMRKKLLVRAPERKLIDRKAEVRRRRGMRKLKNSYSKLTKGA